MATILPPPSKRQKLAASERSREQQDVTETVPEGAGSLKIRFYDEKTGLPIGESAILVPVSEATTSNLELIANRLQGHVSSWIQITVLDSDKPTNL